MFPYTPKITELKFSEYLVHLLSDQVGKGYEELAELLAEAEKFIAGSGA